MLCAAAFLGMAFLASTLSRRYLRSYFALSGIQVPTTEEALRAGEGQRVEFKRGLADEVSRSGSVDVELLKSITAFANSNDGAIFVGIDDAGHVRGLDLDFKRKDAWERRVRQLARTRIKPVPPVQVGFEEIRGMTIGRISVARGEAPLYMLDNVAYLRQGSPDVQAQPDEIISLVSQFAY
jgi:ATP-dependent DNA helicase RecG